MLNCPICQERLGLLRQEACRNCGANLGEFYEVEARETNEDRAEAERHEAFSSSTFYSTGLYAILVFVALFPQFRVKAIRAFGQRPLGLSPSVFGWAVLTLLFLPIPVAFYHFSIVEQRARRDGFNLSGRNGLYEKLFYLSDMHHQHPELSRTRMICLGSMAYGVIVIIGLSIFASKVGL